MIRELVEEAVAGGARRWRACEVLGLTVRTLERWGDVEDDGRHGPNTVPANKLSETERRKLVAIACNGAGYVFGVEAAELIAPGAAELAAQEAAELAAQLVDSEPRPFGQDTRVSRIRVALGDDGSNARGRPN